MSQISHYKGNKINKMKCSLLLASTGKERGFGAVPQISFSQYHGRNKNHFPLLVLFWKLLRFWISLFKIRNQKVGPHIVICWLCDYFFFFANTSYSQLCSPRSLSQPSLGFGSSVLDQQHWPCFWADGCQQQCSQLPGLSVYYGPGSDLLGHRAQAPALQEQPCHWKLIPHLGAAVWLVLPAGNPSLFSPGR